MSTTTLNMIGAELLKLRRRRSLFWTTLASTIGTVVIAWAALVILHENNPDKHGPAGTLDNFNGVMGVVALLGSLVAIVVGATAGAGDERSGVFRDLVATGRSRLTLFSVRLPGVLLYLLPFVAVSVVLSIAATRVFDDGAVVPTGGEIADSIGYVLATTGFGAVLGLGLASLLGSRATAIGIALGWQLVLSPLLAQWNTLGSARKAFSSTALSQFAPDVDGIVAMSAGAAALVLVVWGAVLLGAGAWRTITRDA